MDLEKYMVEQEKAPYLANSLARVRHFLAIESAAISPLEKLVATLGGMLGILMIALVSYQFTGADGAALIVPSMGAAAVLLFAVPHGKMSQPWPLIGGNLISAVIGVSCFKLVPDGVVAASLAVGLAIGAMHLLACVHPPGGATALAAVIGGPAINTLGYNYLLTPILINVIVLLIMAVIFNRFFSWRRYPAVNTSRFSTTRPQDSSQIIEISAIEHALTEMELVMDVTNKDLQRLFQLSLKHAASQQLTPAQVRLHAYYTNGKHGREWSVRRIIDESCATDPNRDMVIYRVVEGRGFNTAHSCTRKEFCQWAAREVFIDGMNK